MIRKLKMDFGSGKEIKSDFLLFEKIIKDRGSVYSVSAGRVKNREDIKNFLKKLKSNKKYAKATHNSFAVRISNDGAIYETKSDDGETGAGNVILRILKKRDFVNIIVVITRWFGGIKLEGDRFKHIQDGTIYILDEIEKNNL
jgi:putative IMPACT (imprinted ancient) family translation regulator